MDQFEVDFLNRKEQLEKIISLCCHSNLSQALSSYVSLHAILSIFPDHHESKQQQQRFIEQLQAAILNQIEEDDPNARQEMLAFCNLSLLFIFISERENADQEIKRKISLLLTSRAEIQKQLANLENCIFDHEIVANLEKLTLASQSSKQKQIPFLQKILANCELALADFTYNNALAVMVDLTLARYLVNNNEDLSLVLEAVAAKLSDLEHKINDAITNAAINEIEQIEYCDLALALNITNHAAWKKRGKLKLAINDQSGIDDLRFAIYFHPVYLQDQEFIQLLIQFFLSRSMDFIRKNDYDSALIDLNEVLSLNPNCIEAHYQVGITYYYSNYNGEKYDKKLCLKAINSFDIVLSHDANHVRAYYFRGVCAFDNNDLDAAQQDLQKVINLNPDFERMGEISDVYAYLANIHFLQADESQYQSAIEYLNHAIQRDDQNTDHYIMRGLMRLATDQIELASEDGKMALELMAENEISDLDIVFQPENAGWIAACLDDGELKSGTLPCVEDLQVDDWLKNTFIILGNFFYRQHAYEETLACFSRIQLTANEQDLVVKINRAEAELTSQQRTLQTSIPSLWQDSKDDTSRVISPLRM